MCSGLIIGHFRKIRVGVKMIKDFKELEFGLVGVEVNNSLKCEENEWELSKLSSVFSVIQGMRLSVYCLSVAPRTLPDTL